MAKPLVIGIDPATNTGLCEGRVGETPVLLTRRLRVSQADEPEDIYGRAVHFFADFLRTRSPDLIAIEEPIVVYGTTNNMTTDMTRGLYAIFTGIAKCKGIAVRPVAISTWRKSFLGRGNLPGAEAKQQCVRLCERLGWRPSDHNAAEAAGVWLWGCGQVAPQFAHRVEPLFVQAAE